MLVAGLLTVAPAASAEPANSAPPSAVTDANRDAMTRGFAALKQGDLQAAHDAFAEAWTAHPSVVVAVSLAEVEMRLEFFVAAAEHWQYVLANLPSSASDQRDSTRAKLDQCRQHIGTITIQAPDESIVVLNDTPIGRAPLGRHVYVKPGVHTVYATKAGSRSISRTFHASPSSKMSFTLTIPVSTLSVPAPRTMPASTAPLAEPSRAAVSTSPGSGSVRTPLFIGGAVLTLASAATGSYFVVKRSDALTDARAALHAAEAERDPSVARNAVCVPADRPASCAVAAEKVGDADRFRNIGVDAFVAAGAFAAGTIATFVLWKAPPSPRSAARLAITPALTQGVPGLSLAGAL